MKKRRSVTHDERHPTIDTFERALGRGVMVDGSRPGSRLESVSAHRNRRARRARYVAVDYRPDEDDGPGS